MVRRVNLSRWTGFERGTKRLHAGLVDSAELANDEVAIVLRGTLEKNGGESLAPRRYLRRC